MYVAAQETITTFDRVIKLTAVLIWPAVLVFFVYVYRTSISRLIRAVVSLAERADEVEIGQVKIKRTLEEVAAKAGSSNATRDSSTVPSSQKVAAQEIEEIVATAPNSRSRDLLQQEVRKKMEALAAQYDYVRETMRSGEKRTSEMDRLTAQMRSLGLASRPFRRSFTTSEDSAGKRLCAIATLQVSPSSEYLPWLFDRFDSEQPFVFFQAAVAILQCVRKYGPRRFHSLRKRLEASIQTLQSYKGGEPDSDTIGVLQTALHELEQLRPH